MCDTVVAALDLLSQLYSASRIWNMSLIDVQSVCVSHIKASVFPLVYPQPAGTQAVLVVKQYMYCHPCMPCPAPACVIACEPVVLPMNHLNDSRL